MLSRGDLSERQLQTALDAQLRGQTRKIGEWLQALQFVTERQVLTGLSLQWSLPLLSSPETVLPAPARLLPAVLRRELGLVPVRFVDAANELYLATSQKVEHSLVSAIGSVLGYGILPCLVSERVMSSWIENAHRDDEDLAQLFDRLTRSEMLRIISSYAARLKCEDLRIARCGPFLWVRLGHRAHASHLLFRLTESSAETAPLYLHAAV